MKEQKSTTSEDYLDSLLNSIMNNEGSNSDVDDLGLFGDSDDKIDLEEMEDDDFISNLEDELFGAIEDTDVKLVDEDEYFEKEITDAELFDIDDDILSIIDDTVEKEESSEKIHEIIKDDNVEEKEDTKEVQEAIEANDSAVDDNLQGLLDVMGIDEGDNIEKEEIEIKPKKEKKKLFSKKKKNKKPTKVNDSVEGIENGEDSVSMNDMLDLSSLSGLMDDNQSHTFSESSFSSDELDNELDFSSMDNSQVEDVHNVMDDPFSDLDFNLDSKNEDSNNSSGAFSFMDGDDEEEENPKKSKKDKKKKEKKQKIKKQKKVSTKPKKAKKTKEKIKKVKEPDEIIHISKGFVLMSLSFAFVFIFAVVFGGDYYTYNKKVSDATKEYVNKNYTEAYNTIFGLEMKKDDDEELFNQIQTVMFVNRHYEAYESLIRMDEYEQALYSLLKGVKMFDKYQNVGRKLNCYDDMQNVLGWIDRGLLETFSLTESQARELNLINNDEKVGYEVAIIAQAAREKAEAEKEALEEAAKEAEKLEQEK